MNAAQIIAPGLRVLSPAAEKGSPWESPNIYLLGDDPVTLIDAGYDRQEQVDLILAEVGKARLIRIIATHGHIDHIGGAWKLRELTGAEIMAHPADAASIERRFPGRKANRALVEGEKMVAGEFSLQILHLPGHTPGHIAILIESEGMIFPGDLVTGTTSTLISPPEGNMKAYLRSLRRLQALPLSLLLPGHGPVVREPARRIAELIEHRQLRELCILKCLAEAAEPLSLAALVRTMYLGLIHPQMMGAAMLTAWAHLEKLIEEKTVTAAPEGETSPFSLKFSLPARVRPELEKLLARAKNGS